MGINEWSDGWYPFVDILWDNRLTASERISIYMSNYKYFPHEVVSSLKEVFPSLK